MNFSPKDFRAIDKECWNWSLKSEEPKKEIQCNLEGFDVTIILTRMVVNEDGGNYNVITPSRISICPNDPKIEAIFKKHLVQHTTLPEWKPNIWVFANNPNISLPCLQYELRFFDNEISLRTKIDEKEKTSEGSCIIS